MRQNRIRELRLARHMTLAKLAEMVDISHPYLARLESAKRTLSLPIAEKLATAMGVTLGDVLGVDTNSMTPKGVAVAGLREDAQPYVPQQGEAAPKFDKKGTIDMWRITSDALDKAGIKRGDIVYIDISSEAVDNLKPLDCVIAQVFGDGLLDHKETVLRQFVPPSLLITNTSGKAAPILDLDRDEVYIKGVICGTFSPMRG
jgi:transcriptional regulator with XRE-family HTH domain